MTLAGARRFLARIAAIRRHHGIPLRHQLASYRMFAREFGMDAAEFIGYRLWDAALPLATRATRISNRERRAIEYRINPREPNLQIRDKAWAAARLDDAGIPTAPVLALASLDGRTRPAADRFPVIVGLEAILALLEAVPDGGVVCKPFDGGAGRNVQVFRRTRGALEALDGSRWSAERLTAFLALEPLWKIEARLDTHPVLRAMSGPTLGTLRLTTFRTLDGAVHLLPPVLKIPIGAGGVDHFSHGEGQLAAAIDTSSGALAPAVRWLDLDHHAVHPLTGAPIAGVVVPHLAAARDLATRAADCFPPLLSLGLDVAVTTDGPVVIEVNPCWGERLHQAASTEGILVGPFRAFVEERGLGDVVRLAARDRLR